MQCVWHVRGGRVLAAKTAKELRLALRSGNVSVKLVFEQVWEDRTGVLTEFRCISGHPDFLLIYVDTAACREYEQASLKLRYPSPRAWHSKRMSESTMFNLGGFLLEIRSTSVLIR